MRVNPMPAAVLALLLAAVLAALPAHASSDDAVPGQGHKAKASLDDRADPRVRTDDVGKAGRMGRKELAPGAYFNDRHREAVRAYYAAHADKDASNGPANKWRIGERLPGTVAVTAVPQPVMLKLPPMPPGYRYVQAGGDVLLIAAGSQMVVDGISGSKR
jgi:Ni/Co efflux regulator RcnB